MNVPHWDDESRNPTRDLKRLDKAQALHVAAQAIPDELPGYGSAIAGLAKSTLEGLAWEMVNDVYCGLYRRWSEDQNDDLPF